MRRLVAGLLLLSTACALPGIVGMPEPTPTHAAPTVTLQPATSTPVVKPRPTYTPTPEPEPTPTPPADPRLAAEGVLVLPQPLFVGDRLSFDIDPFFPEGFGWHEEEEPSVTLTLPNGETTSAPVLDMGLDGAAQARFYWVGEAAGEGTNGAQDLQTQVFTVTLVLPEGVHDPDPGNNTLVLEVPVRPREALPPPEPGAGWAVTETTGFSLHYITGSSAERDLMAIVDEAGEAYEEVGRQFAAMGAAVPADAAVEIYLLDRVVGQGGYASPDWVAVTYTDRAYSPVSLDLVFRHELTHRLDEALGCDGAPAMLREGLAVALAGGHYRRESLRDKAAALYGTTHYIPLAELPEAFYTHQHEAGYLEAGGIITYLVDRWGWEVVLRICRVASEADGDEAERWAAALQELGIAGPAELEVLWQGWLHTSDVVPQDGRLLELELQLMDTMRAYQAVYDPAAHFLEGILFSPAEAARMEIVADFVRRPRSPEAIALELLLAMGQEALAKGDPGVLRMVLSELDVAIDLGPEASPLAGDIVVVTQEAIARGWEPYRLVLEAEDRLRVYVLSRSAWPMQSVLVARHEGGGWKLSGAMWGE